MGDVPSSHPRYLSLKLRDRIVAGVEAGITSTHGLIAHGRGETFDYLLGEKTGDFALSAIEVAAKLLLQAKHPVISVNGNTAALVAEELVGLAHVLKAPLEVNIFHPSKEREQKIKMALLNAGTKDVLLPAADCEILHLDSNRRFVNREGIFKADVVFVPLEDGDRTEALIKNGKKVITVDLNPSSRTAKMATVTIVDNIIRALPLLTQKVSTLQNSSFELNTYDNQVFLEQARKEIVSGF
jgi:4-phosphopantoate--beta-alanine ligase